MKISHRSALPAAVVVLLGSVALAEDWVKHYADRVAVFEAENKKLDPQVKHVVLAGDSLTEGWSAPRVKRFLPGLAERVLNRGISSDGVGLNDRGVLHRLDSSIFDCKASHAFLLIGVNDIGKDGSGVDRAARALEKVVQAVHDKKGAPELVLLTLAPAAKNYKAMNPAIVKFNAKVKEIAAATSTSVLDLHALVVDSQGALPEDLTTDGLHWKDGVYEKLGQEIEKIVARPPAKKKR
jgi:lysophospholipase L1-like esterase